MTDSKKISPLADSFQVVLKELKKRLSPEELADLLKKCDMDSLNEDTRTDTKSTSTIPAE